MTRSGTPVPADVLTDFAIVVGSERAGCESAWTSADPGMTILGSESTAR